ncbi:hypothetical protein [Streptomyces sp. NPDC001774]
MTVGDSGSIGEEESLPELCDLCGTVIADPGQYRASVPDSSAVYWHDPEMADGTRMIVACSAGHLERLAEEYANRPFVGAELWAGQMARAMFWHSGEISEDDLVAESGLTPEQIEQAVAWHNLQCDRQQRHPGESPGTGQ